MSNYVYFFAFLSFLRFCNVDPDSPAIENVTLEERWATDSVLRTPESVLYDEDRRLIYVANINGINPRQKDGDGFISLLKPNGEIKKLRWITGLNDPKGMAVKHNKLYVADITELIQIDIYKASITKRYPIEGSIFLNDVTVDARGNVYVSDTRANTIYKLKDDSVTVFLEGAEITGPNGLLAQHHNLIMGLANTGEVKKVNYTTMAITPWASGIPNTDGIAKDRKHNYLISNWAGEVYYVWSSGQKIKILDTKAQNINSADIDFMPAGDILLVPTFFDNRVVAYKLKYHTENM